MAKKRATLRHKAHEEIQKIHFGLNPRSKVFLCAFVALCETDLSSYFQ